MTMTREEKRQDNQDKLMLSIMAHVDREESEYPQKELDKFKTELKRNASSLFSGAEIETQLKKERDRRFEERRAEVLAKRPEQEAANPLGARTGRATMKDGGKGIEALRQVVPEVVERMGYQEGGDIQNDHKLVMEALYQDRLKNNKSFKDFEKSTAGKLYRKLIKLGSVATGTKPKSLNAMSGEYLTSEEVDEYSKVFKKLQSNDKEEPRTTRQQKAEGGEMDQQMDMLMGMEQEQTMLPDEEMEEDYVDYVVEETLSNEDRNYLIDALEKDDRLSMIFDQVVESATEFTGSGTVEGPGTGRSDSIPARLSDGEFVFTAKATDEIGSDNLMSMMKDAEAAANERQSVAYGGMVEDEGDPKAIPIQTTGSQTAQGNIPRVAEPNRKVDEEMLKASPRRYYVPLSG